MRHRTRLPVALVCLALLSASAPPAEAPVAAEGRSRVEQAEQPREPATFVSMAASDRTNQIARFAGRLAVKASSTWSGWPADRAIDGDPATSWFSAQDDSAARGKRPWLEVGFPEPIQVARVRLVGNREPPWHLGYSILVVEVTLLDGEGRVLARVTNEVAAGGNDIVLDAPKPLAGVRVVRLASLADQGSENAYGDVAIGELEVY